LSTRREADPESFHESSHLDGDVDMVAVIRAALAEERKRREAGRPDWELPMRPDHGHQLLDDREKTVNPGYSAIGRLKGLAELRGVARAVAALGVE
ncbi:MAG TPA: mannonate dehydratase, partial [Arenibaculum sp.]|nr:mannonate dehydratase [Arenibaculum sp.]